MSDPRKEQEELEPDDPELAALADAILGDGDEPAARDSSRRAGHLAEPLSVLGKIAALHRSLGLSDTELPARVEGNERLHTWGHLRLVEQIGQGAFGIVFRAWDPNLNRAVALKMLGPAHASSAWVLEEARNLAAIRHPNVVTVYGADRIDGDVGFWTELIEGQTLAELVAAGGPLGEREAIEIGLDVCRAVAAVHAAGLLHRDIKANNVMREKTGRIVLLDFGATKNVLLDTAPSARIGDPQGPTGTPLYVAPELWQRQLATPQSDIYSIGVLLYFLLTGTYPVEGATVADVTDAHRRGTRVALRERRQDLSDAVADVVERALARQPARRFATVQALSAALHGARPEGRRRFPLRSVSLALALVAAVVTAAVWMSQAVSEPALTTTMAPTEMLGDPVGEPSHDGRFYAVRKRTGLGIWDVDASISPLIRETPAGAIGIDSALVSPTGDQVAYVWEFSNGAFELHVANRDGSFPRLLLEQRDVYQPQLMDWSYDGRHLLCWLRQKNGTADLVKVPVAGGQPEILHTTTQVVGHASLAPDGNAAVFDARLKTGFTTYITGRGNGATALVDGGRDPEWAPDGRHVVFLKPSPAHELSFDVWMIRVDARAARGTPMLVAPNVGNVVMSVTRDGRIYSLLLRPLLSTFVRSLDPDGLKPPGPPERMLPDAISSYSSPSWSPKDGREIAFFDVLWDVVAPGQPLRRLAVYDVATKRSQLVNTKLSFQRGFRPAWLDADHVVVWGADRPEKSPEGYFKINVRNDETTPLLLKDELGFSEGPANPLPNGSGLLLKVPPGDLVVYRYSDRNTRTVASSSKQSSIGGLFVLSPDGLSVAFVRQEWQESGRSKRLLVKRLDGGAERELVSEPDIQWLEVQTWTPDGSHVIYAKGDISPSQDLPLFRVPATGGRPVNLQMMIPKQPNPLVLNPTGTRAAYPDRRLRIELWIRWLPREARERW